MTIEDQTGFVQLIHKLTRNAATAQTHTCTKTFDPTLKAHVYLYHFEKYF